MQSLATLPLISIITINYNNSACLLNTVLSVINQSEKNYEYIVIDGGSSDRSVDILKEYDSHINLCISEKDKGIFDAMNKGISLASCEYLMFLNSGDTLSDKTVLATCQHYLQNFPDTDVFYGNIFTYEQNVKGVWNHPEELSISFFKTQNINHQASLIKASLFREFGSYPEKYLLAGDHWLFLISFINSKKFRHINYPLVIYDKSGISTRKKESYQKEMENMWHELVPEYVNNLVKDYLEVAYASRYKFLRVVVPVHHIITYHKKMVLLILILLIAVVLLLQH